MMQVSGDMQILGPAEKPKNGGNLCLSQVESVDGRNEATIWHSEARGWRVPDRSGRREKGLPGRTAGVGNAGPSCVDGERQDWVFGRPAIVLNIQWPGEANLGLGNIRLDRGKFPDGELELTRKAAEERKGLHGEILMVFGFG